MTPELSAEHGADHEHVYRCQDCGEIGRAPVAHGAEDVVLLRRAKATLEAVDDWGHPWSHNESVREVELLLTDIDAALTDGTE